MDNTLQLLTKAKQGDEKARTELIESNLRLVWSVARRFLNRGQDLEDLFQIGCIGLVKAIDHFDLERPVKLSTYAVPLIIGEIKRFLRDDGMIKVSRTLKENGYRIQMTSKKMQEQLGREPTIEEIAATMEMSTEDVVIALDANVSVDSIDRTITTGEGEGVPLESRISDPKNEQKLLENRLLVEDMMHSLNDTEQKIIRYRYYEDKTQSQVGELLKISQVQISRMEKRALQKMREVMGENS